MLQRGGSFGCLAREVNIQHENFRIAKLLFLPSFSGLSTNNPEACYFGFCISDKSASNIPMFLSFIMHALHFAEVMCEWVSHYMYKLKLSMHAVMLVDVSRFGASECMEVFSCRVVFMLFNSSHNTL